MWLENEFSKFLKKNLARKHNIFVSQKTGLQKFFFIKELVIFAVLSNFFFELVYR
jgi:hypothetical protein